MQPSIDSIPKFATDLEAFAQQQTFMQYILANLYSSTQQQQQHNNTNTSNLITTSVATNNSASKKTTYNIDSLIGSAASCNGGLKVFGQEQLTRLAYLINSGNGASLGVDLSNLMIPGGGAASLLGGVASMVGHHQNHGTVVSAVTTKTTSSDLSPTLSPTSSTSSVISNSSNSGNSCSGSSSSLTTLTTSNTSTTNNCNYLNNNKILNAQFFNNNVSSLPCTSFR